MPQDIARARNEGEDDQLLMLVEQVLEGNNVERGGRCAAWNENRRGKTGIVQSIDGFAAERVADD
jgi:hypothetical protein